MSTKSVSVLGSTGSIGAQTLQIAAEFPEQFKVVALSAGRNLDLLEQQVRRHRPQAVALAAAELLPSLRQRLSDLQPQPELLAGGGGGGGGGGRHGGQGAPLATRQYNQPSASLVVLL